MEPAKRRRATTERQHSEEISSTRKLDYNKNSSMLWPFCVCHERNEGNSAGCSQVAKKEEQDEALVSMILAGTQSFHIVEDKGFRKFVAKLNPTYVLPTRKAIKAMVKVKYQKVKEKAKVEVHKAHAVSLTADMWTSINMDVYLAITGHFIDDNTQLKSTLLGVLKFPQVHAAEHLACGISSLMDEWGIRSKITCLVTDGAPNMIACGKELRLRHAICIAHTLKLIVTKALELTPVLSAIRSKAKYLVTYFTNSTTAREMVDLVQDSMKRPKKKLIQEVETRWNSTFQMLERLLELREPVGVALASLRTGISALSSEEYSVVRGCLSILSPFHEAIRELSAEKNVPGSKVAPLLKMIERMLQEEIINATVPIARELGEHLIEILRERLLKVQSMSIISLATLLDPRFKILGFFSAAQAEEAVKRLTDECANGIGYRNSSSTSASTSQDAATKRPGDKLWSYLDVLPLTEPRRTNSVTADIEVQQYLGEPNLDRTENPLEYWERQKYIYPNLYNLAVRYLCTPASSVPCKRVFTKAGEVVSKKRNCLSSDTVEKILFLNENE